MYVHTAVCCVCIYIEKLINELFALIAVLKNVKKKKIIIEKNSALKELENHCVECPANSSLSVCESAVLDEKEKS